MFLLTPLCCSFDLSLSCFYVPCCVIHGLAVFMKLLFNLEGLWVWLWVQCDSAVWCILSCSSDRCTCLSLSRFLSGVVELCRFITLCTPHTPQTHRHVLYEQHLDRTQVASVLSLRDGCKVQGLVWRFLLTALYLSWHCRQRRNLLDWVGARIAYRPKDWFLYSWTRFRNCVMVRKSG